MPHRNSPLSTKDRAARIRAELKAMGWSSRDVSVRAETYSLGATIRVTVRNPAVPMAAVRKVAGVYQTVSYCQVTGEVLGGGNTYVEVEYARETIDSMAAPLLALLLTVADEPGRVVDLGDGWMAARSDEPGDYWRAWSSSDERDVYCWSADFCARQVAERKAASAQREAA